MAIMIRRALSLIAALALGLAPINAHAFSRVKDLADIEGIRTNILIGYGLVVGLGGTGDQLNNSPFTRQAMQTMLERLAAIGHRGISLVCVNPRVPTDQMGRLVRGYADGRRGPQRLCSEEMPGGLGAALAIENFA